MIKNKVFISSPESIRSSGQCAGILPLKGELEGVVESGVR
jgi:hypothetical protein